MNPQRMVSQRTLFNWVLDASLALSGLVASISGVYFMFLPDGGYKGGRNPYYGIKILFERATWEDIHIWSGLAMVAIALIHLIYHWKWVTAMARRLYREARSTTKTMNRNTAFNILINVLLGLGFLAAGISGVYFFVVGGNHGGAATDPNFLFTRGVWDLVHTWSSVLMMSAALIHFTIHWQWVVKVTRRMVTNLLPTEVRVAPLADQTN